MYCVAEDRNLMTRTKTLLVYSLDIAEANRSAANVVFFNVQLQRTKFNQLHLIR